MSIKVPPVCNTSIEPPTSNMWRTPESQSVLQEHYLKQEEKCMIITDARPSVIVADEARAKLFSMLDIKLATVNEPASLSQTTVRTTDGSTASFIKHPVSGDWMLRSHSGIDVITYTRHRRLDHLPHYQSALDAACKRVEYSGSLLDYSVGGVSMQFIRDEKGNKILINSVQEPILALDLTEDERHAIITSADKHFSFTSSRRGGFVKVQFATPTSKDIWCWDNDGVTEILNPYTMEQTNVDYNMVKYRLRKSDELLIKVLDSGNSNVALLLGKPGTGKTFFTECYAKRTAAEYIYTLCHDGTNSEDLFYSINVGKAVLREADSSDEIYQAGILLRAVRASHKHKVVVCIDEIDKASKRTENLFLDFAETYRVPFLGTQEQGVKENIVLFFTSNGYRPHSEAFLRRCYRHHFDFLPRSVEISLIGGTFASSIVDALTAIREGGASSPSVKEGMLFSHNLQFARNVKDVECLMYAHLCKEPEDMDILQKSNFANKFITKVF